MASVVPSGDGFKEGESHKTILKGFKKGSTVFYKITGNNVNDDDFSIGRIAGKIRIGKNGAAKLIHKFREDKATEGTENFNIQAFSDKNMAKQLAESYDVGIMDTSTADNGKDPVTGLVIYGQSYGYQLRVESGNTKYRDYFLSPIKQPDSQYGAGFEIFADSSSPYGEFTTSDTKLGVSSLTYWDPIGSNSGTFTTQNNRQQLDIYGMIDGKLVGLTATLEIGSLLA